MDVTEAKLKQYVFDNTGFEESQLYENRCCITGLEFLNFLFQAILIHGKMRTAGQSRQILTLNAFFDKAIDRGLLTVTLVYLIKVSSEIKPSVERDTMEDWLLSFANQKIRMQNKFFSQREFLEFYNDVFFKT